MLNRYPTPIGNIDLSLAARRIEREERQRYAAAERQVKAVRDIVAIAAKAMRAIEDCRPSDSEPQEVPFQ